MSTAETPVAAPLGELTVEMLTGHFGFTLCEGPRLNYVRRFNRGYAIHLLNYGPLGKLPPPAWSVWLWQVSDDATVALPLPSLALYARDLSKILSLYEDIPF